MKTSESLPLDRYYYTFICSVHDFSNRPVMLQAGVKHPWVEAWLEQGSTTMILRTDLEIGGGHITVSLNVISSHLLHDSLLIVVAERTAKFVIVHSWPVLLNAPTPGHLPSKQNHTVSVQPSSVTLFRVSGARTHTHTHIYQCMTFNPQNHVQIQGISKTASSVIWVTWFLL